MGSISPDDEPDRVVRPLRPLEPRLYQLSTIDQYVPKRWITRLMYFKLPDDAEPKQVFEALKNGLRQVITVYPQLAGKVVRHPDKPNWVGVQTEQDSAVHLTFRDHWKTSNSTLPSYAWLKQRGFPMQGLVALVCPDAMECEVSEGSCIFAAQANFIQGGLILTSVANHVLLDGGSYAELHKCWSYHTANPPEDGRANLPPLLGHPADVVEQLSNGTSDLGRIDVKTWVAGDAARSTFYMPPPGTPASSVAHPKKQNERVSRITAGSTFRIWTISKAKQQELKSMANAWSTMDSIFAMLWIRRTVHADMIKKGLDTAFARIPIDMRERLQPRIRDWYLGNTVAMLTTEMPTADLEADIAISLPQTAQKLRESIKSFSTDNFLAFIGVANDLPTDKAMVYPFSAVFDPCMLLNDHSKMEFYALNWGPILGHIERVRDVMDDVPVRGLSLCLTMPKLPDGTLEVVTLFDTDVNSALEKDETFLRFFTLQGDGSFEA